MPRVFLSVPGLSKLEKLCGVTNQGNVIRYVGGTPFPIPVAGHALTQPQHAPLFAAVYVNAHRESFVTSVPVRIGAYSNQNAESSLL